MPGEGEVKGAEDVVGRAGAGAPGTGPPDAFGAERYVGVRRARARLRQTLVAMTAETVLAEHASPGEATVQVLHGRVVLRSGDDEWEGREGDLLVIPPARHDLRAVVDAVIVLTTAVR